MGGANHSEPRFETPNNYVLTEMRCLGQSCDGGRSGTIKPWRAGNDGGLVMEHEGRQVIILVEEIFNDQEFWYPYYRLKEAGAKVVVVGSAMQVYTGKAGTQVKPDVTAETISAADFDGVVIPGGYAPDHMRRNPAMVKLVRDLFEGGKVVAAICHAGWMLASAKILRGRTVTSFFSIKDDLIHAGAHYVDQEVAVDGKLITSRKPEDLPAFMRAILEAL